MKTLIAKVFTLLIILWGTGTVPGMAQVYSEHTLKGRITYLSSGKQPVIGAQVTADRWANAARTDNHGYFSLVFQNKEGGDETQLHVRLGTLVVVNEKELIVTLKKDQEKEIKLYMCEKKRLDKLRADYYDISIANITKRFREETERLRKDNKLPLEAIARLEREKQSLIEQARELADQFARLNFDDISEMRRKALEHFKAGELKKAIDTLDFDTLKENIRKAEEQKRQGIKGLLEKAWYSRLDFQFNLAKQCYIEAVKSDPGNYDAVYTCADFLYDQAQYLEARPYYERLPSLANTEEQRAVALGGLGTLYSKNNQPSEALKIYLEVLNIYQQLAQKNPGAFLQDVATAQSNLGNLYSDNNQLSEGKHAYEEALKIRKQLAQKNPGTFLQDVAETQNNLGVLYSANNQLSEAKHAYEEALKIRIQLAEKNPSAFLQYVATTQSNLGILYFYQDQLEKARKILKQAVDTRKQLTAKNPRAFEIDLCKSMIALGRFVHFKLLVEKEDLSHLEKADALINEAITRLQKYPEVPQAVQLLEVAQEAKEFIDEIKEELEKIKGPPAR